MAILEDTYKNHAVHQAVDQFKETLDSANEKAADIKARDYLDALEQAISFIDKKLSLSSPVLNSGARLNNIQKPVQQSLNELSQFVTNGNQGHLANAYTNLEGALQQAKFMIVISDGDEGVSVTDAISFKNQAKKAIENIEVQVGEVVDLVNKARGDVESVQEQAGALLQSINEMDSKIKIKIEEVESQFAEQQRGFGDEYIKLEKYLTDSSKEMVSEIEEKKQEAERIVRLVGNIGLTGNYRGIAERERESANLMRWIALGCFLAMFLVIGATLVLATINGVNPWLTAFRFTAGLVLVIPATYAARESSKHRIAEERNKRTELELASIDAYLDDLPDQNKHTIKSELSKRFFGLSIDDGEGKDEAVGAKSIVALLKDAIAALGK